MLIPLVRSFLLHSKQKIHKNLTLVLEVVNFDLPTFYLKFTVSWVLRKNIFQFYLNSNFASFYILLGKDDSKFAKLLYFTGKGVNILNFRVYFLGNMQGPLLSKKMNRRICLLMGFRDDFHKNAQDFWALDPKCSRFLSLPGVSTLIKVALQIETILFL